MPPECCYAGASLYCTLHIPVQTSPLSASPGAKVPNRRASIIAIFSGSKGLGGSPVPSGVKSLMSAFERKGSDEHKQMPLQNTKKGLSVNMLFHKTQATAIEVYNPPPAQNTSRRLSVNMLFQKNQKKVGEDNIQSLTKKTNTIASRSMANVFVQIPTTITDSQLLSSTDNLRLFGNNKPFPLEIRSNIIPSASKALKLEGSISSLSTVGVVDVNTGTYTMLNSDSSDYVIAKQESVPVLLPLDSDIISTEPIEFKSITNIDLSMSPTAGIKPSIQSEVKVFDRKRNNRESFMQVAGKFAETRKLFEKKQRDEELLRPVIGHGDNLKKQKSDYADVLKLGDIGKSLFQHDKNNSDVSLTSISKESTLSIVEKRRSLSPNLLSPIEMLEKRKSGLLIIQAQRLSSTPNSVESLIARTNSRSISYVIPPLELGSPLALPPSRTSRDKRATYSDSKGALLNATYHIIKGSSKMAFLDCERLMNCNKDECVLQLRSLKENMHLICEQVNLFIDQASSGIATVDLRRNAIEMVRIEKDFLREFSAGKNSAEFKHLLAQINTNIDFVMRRFPGYTHKHIVKPCDGFKEEGVYDAPTLDGGDRKIIDFAKSVIDFLPICYHRLHFLNQEVFTYIGVMDKLGPVIVSIKREQTTDKDADGEDWIYRAILRILDQPERRETILPTQIKKSILGGVSRKAIIGLLHKDIVTSKLKLIEDKTIELKLLQLDELQYSLKYKFGIILCAPGQTTDDEYFQNNSGSANYEKFLTLLGDRVELKGFKGFLAGLDSNDGRTGTHSIYTKWRDFEVMFHVSTLLPYNAKDSQQIERKRHIGNDVINIVFLDGDVEFDPKCIKTQFTHIFIVVKAETFVRNGMQVEGFRVAITSNLDVPKFGPPLPNPSRFFDDVQLHDFLIAKLINGENAAYKAPRFSKPHHRASHAIFENIVDEYFRNPKKSVAKSSDNGRKSDNDTGGGLSYANPLSKTRASLAILFMGSGNDKSTKLQIDSAMSPNIVFNNHSPLKREKSLAASQDEHKTSQHYSQKSATEEFSSHQTSTRSDDVVEVTSRGNMHLCRSNFSDDAVNSRTLGTLNLM